MECISVIRICFVCHGNICRSVSGQYILQDIVNRAGRADDFLIESAATSTEEIGNPIYPPMEKALRRKGIPIGMHRARQLVRSDYGQYDLFIGFDEENIFCMRQILGEDPDKFRSNPAKSEGLMQRPFTLRDDIQKVKKPSISESLRSNNDKKFNYPGKIHYFSEFTDHLRRIIDDPWYTRRFDECAEQIMEGCEGLYRAWMNR